MIATDKRTVLKRVRAARENVEAEIRGNRGGGRLYAAGLSNEGYAGGYLQALDDVEAALVHGHVGDPRRYWTNQE